MNISMQGVSATLFYGTFVLAVALFAALFWMIVRYFFRPSFHKPVLGQFRLIGMLFVVAFCLRIVWCGARSTISPIKSSRL